MTAMLDKGLNDAATAAGISLQVGSVGTMFGFYFLKTTGTVITDYASAKQHADTERYARFFHAMLEQGVYFAPSQFEAGFICSTHTADDIQAMLVAAKNIFSLLASN